MSVGQASVYNCGCWCPCLSQVCPRWTFPIFIYPILCPHRSSCSINFQFSRPLSMLVLHSWMRFHHPMAVKSCSFLKEDQEQTPLLVYNLKFHSPNESLPLWVPTGRFIITLKLFFLMIKFCIDVLSFFLPFTLLLSFLLSFHPSIIAVAASAGFSVTGLSVRSTASYRTAETSGT